LSAAGGVGSVAGSIFYGPTNDPLVPIGGEKNFNKDTANPLKQIPSGDIDLKQSPYFINSR
jgi:hypothetical protein